jgi:lysophospholipase L1-like esterase
MTLRPYFLSLIALITTSIGLDVSACSPDRSLPKESVLKCDSSGTFLKKHNCFIELSKTSYTTWKGQQGVVFIGDSITEGWDNRPVSGIRAYNREFRKYNPLNFGISGDKTQNVIWRLTDGGELYQLKRNPPFAIVLKIGTNNLASANDKDIADGIKKIVKILREGLPTTKILLVGVLPRLRATGTTVKDINKKIDSINKSISVLDENEKLGPTKAMIRFLNVKASIPNFDLIQFNKEWLVDQLHLTEEGYGRWSKLISPYLKKMITYDHNGKERKQAIVPSRLKIKNPDCQRLHN